MSSLPSSTLAAVEPSEPAYQRVIDEICNLNWANLSDEDVIKTADWKESFRQSSQHSKHFLVEHIRFDSDPDQGHGALCRHLAPDDREFKHMLIDAVPHLMSPG